MPRTPKPLPDKLSDLLDLAVTDAQKIAKKPGYKLDMGVWHAMQRGSGRRAKEVCRVCMAGAVMACSIGVRRDLILCPRDTTEPVKLEAIDEIRHGNIRGALGVLGTNPKTHVEGAACESARSLIKGSYNESTGRAPWRVYRKAAAILREAGL